MCVLISLWKYYCFFSFIRDKGKEKVIFHCSLSPFVLYWNRHESFVIVCLQCMWRIMSRSFIVLNEQSFWVFLANTGSFWWLTHDKHRHKWIWIKAIRRKRTKIYVCPTWIVDILHWNILSIIQQSVIIDNVIYLSIYSDLIIYAHIYLVQSILMYLPISTALSIPIYLSIYLSMSVSVCLYLFQFIFVFIHILFDRIYFSITSQSVFVYLCLYLSFSIIVCVLGIVVRPKLTCIINSSSTILLCEITLSVCGISRSTSSTTTNIGHHQIVSSAYPYSILFKFC